MSAMHDKRDNEDIVNHHGSDDRVVTDSVHERFRQVHVRCVECGRDIVGNEAAIKDHFNNSHPSNKHCRYCKGKVFIYRRVERNDSQASQDFVYHKCEHNEQRETNAS